MSHHHPQQYRSAHPAGHNGKTNPKFDQQGGTRAAGSIGAKTPSAAEILKKKNGYLRHAREVSYLMQAKSEGESAESWVEEEVKKIRGTTGSKPRRVQSFLGGAFLRMYLDGKVDSKTVEKAGEEIHDSPEFKKLAEELNKYLQGSIDTHHLTKAEPEKLRSLADQHLKAIKKSRGIAFRYTLNAVIGGVTGVEVKSVTHLQDKTVPEGTASTYRVDINFSDTYDFQNKRTGEYDRYRKQLAKYLVANDFDKFDDAYEREAQPIIKSWHHTKLDNAAVFASYMYALEVRGWTPGGLPWDVTIPAEITIIYKHPAPSAGKHPSTHHPAKHP